VQIPELHRATAAARATASSLGLRADEAVVLNNSNKLSLRLLPADTMARVAPAADQVASFELGLAQRLAAAGSPIAALDSRAGSHVHERDGFVITFWTFYQQPPSAGPAAPREISAPAFAEALHRLHAGLRTIDVPAPHFTDRVEHARRLMADHDRTPALPEPDRALLTEILHRPLPTGERGEQLLHGEPHPGNLLATADGPLFIDLETCCRGPLEFDLAHAPAEVADHYPGVDHHLLQACRRLVLAMITAWRWDRDDQLPDGHSLAEQWTAQLRASH
jgi:Ser/Thr protein kinase RdoA (MazF antagonist)